MKDTERAEITEGLKVAASVLELMAKDYPQKYTTLYVVRDRVLKGIELIEEQENTITALMGGYGDTCDIDKPCM